MKQIIDREGVMFQVDYESAIGEIPVTINSMRLLNSRYAPIGPDLTAMFDKMFILRDPANGERFLSGVVDELNCLVKEIRV